MICPECGGAWKVKKVRDDNKPIWWPFGQKDSHKRHVCSKCGYLDERKTWVNDEYVGPPGLETEGDREKRKIAREFYHEGRMPCCGNPIGFYEGPRGGAGINIKCAHCGAKWNVAPIAQIIERI